MLLIKYNKTNFERTLIKHERGGVTHAEPT